MKRSSTIFLKIVILLLVLGTATWMIWFPQTEGRAANLDLVKIYSDPLIIYLYVSSVPFYVALYQAIKLLGFIEKNKIFSKEAVKAVRKIKYCAIVFIGFVAAAISYISIMARVINNPDDDPAGFVALGLAIIFTSTVITAAADVFQRILQKAVSKKSRKI